MWHRNSADDSSFLVFCRYFVDEKIDGTHVSVFAVFDGHGGKYVSSKARSDLMPLIRSKIQEMVRMKKARRHFIAKSDDKIKQFSAEYYVRKFGKNDNHLVEAFKQMLHDEIIDFDEEMQLEPENNYCGSTAVIALVSGHYLIVANVGDSRAILGNTSDKAIRITKDHKPDDVSVCKQKTGISHVEMCKQIPDANHFRNKNKTFILSMHVCSQLKGRASSR